MESRRYGLILLLAFAPEAGFATPAWISVVKQAIVRFITLSAISLFYIVSRFVIIHRAEASFAEALMTVDVGAESFVSGDRLFPRGGPWRGFSSATPAREPSPVVGAINKETNGTASIFLKAHVSTRT